MGFSIINYSFWGTSNVGTPHVVNVRIQRHSPTITEAEAPMDAAAEAAEALIEVGTGEKYHLTLHPHFVSQSVPNICSPPARWGLLDFMSVDFRRLLPPSAAFRLLRTSTTTIHAKCSLPDLNRENPRQVFPAGPQPP